MNNNKIDAIYSRQSVDKADSISIESQIEFCRHELRGGSFKEYTDKGFSGKNTDRPQFQQLVQDIEQGLVRRVIVYKLDRISRSIIDFASMMELFQQNGVEFVSSTEKFDTSTPMGRAMLNICIVFAQLERETIQKRVTDAFYSRAKRGFQVGGLAPFGFNFEDTVIDGINTKKLVADPTTAPYVKLMYEMYSNPNVSLGDITRHFTELGISIGGGQLHRSTFSNLMKNPVYVQADLEIYEFFKSQGADIVNDPADFTGLNGCYIYQGRDIAGCKNVTLKDRVLVVAPHEGLIPPEQWLAVRKRLLTTRSFGSGVERGGGRGIKLKILGCRVKLNVVCAGQLWCMPITPTKTVSEQDSSDAVNERKRKTAKGQTLPQRPIPKEHDIHHKPP